MFYLMLPYTIMHWNLYENSVIYDNIVFSSRTFTEYMIIYYNLPEHSEIYDFLYDHIRYDDNCERLQGWPGPGPFNYQPKDREGLGHF